MQRIVPPVVPEQEVNEPFLGQESRRCIHLGHVFPNLIFVKVLASYDYKSSLGIRVLLWGHYVIPNWHIKTWRVAYWSHLGHTEITPLYDVGLMTWWNKPDVSKPEPEQIGEGPAAETETSATRATEQ